MPFSQLQRRDSWPPTIVRIDHDQSTHEIYLDDHYDPIDEDPFSHFLTSPEDIEDSAEADLEDLSAGIESSSSSIELPVRAVSPSSLERIFEGQGRSRGLKVPLTLKDFTKLHSAKRSRRVSYNDEVGLGIDVPATRGRPTVRTLARTCPPGRGRGQTRSLPGMRRPHSWREPSPDVWSIKEEHELESGSERLPDTPASHEKETPYGTPESLGEIPSLEASPQILPIPKPKLKKRVHWAF